MTLTSMCLQWLTWQESSCLISILRGSLTAPQKLSMLKGAPYWIRPGGTDSLTLQNRHTEESGDTPKEVWCMISFRLLMTKLPTSPT